MEVNGPLHARGKSPQYPLNRHLGVRLVSIEDKTFSPLPGIEHEFPHYPARNIVTLLTDASKNANNNNSIN
jgi:hypothetical protein